MYSSHSGTPTESPVVFATSVFVAVLAADVFVVFVTTAVLDRFVPVFTVVFEAVPHPAETMATQNAVMLTKAL